MSSVAIIDGRVHMKKLQHGIEKRHEMPSHALSRRDILKAGALGLAILGSGGILLAPKRADAQQINVRGLTVETFRLEDTLTNLTTNSRQYQKGERNDSGVYSNMVGISGAGIMGGVILRPNGGQNGFSVLYPASRDRDPHREGAGTWGIEITPFLTMVRDVSSSSVTRMRVLLERTTDTNQHDPIINVYAIPVDSQDRITSGFSGGVLALVASYYPDRGIVYGGRVLLLEPGVPEPDRIARR
jgi:hypothetical protein